MFAVIVPEMFINNVVAGAAFARYAGGAFARIRIAGLGHEIGNHAMELHAVVKTLLREVDEVGNRVWRLILEELDENWPLGCFDHGARQVVGSSFLLSQT